MYLKIHCVNYYQCETPSPFPCLSDFDLPEYDDIIREIMEQPAPQVKPYLKGLTLCIHLPKRRPFSSF